MSQDTLGREFDPVIPPIGPQNGREMPVFGHISPEIVDQPPESSPESPGHGDIFSATLPLYPNEDPDIDLMPLFLKGSARTPKLRDHPVVHFAVPGSPQIPCDTGSARRVFEDSGTVTHLLQGAGKGELQPEMSLGEDFPPRFEGCPPPFQEEIPGGFRKKGMVRSIPFTSAG